MILTLLRIHWTSLSRDRVAQVMTFVLPMVFFTVFAMVFGGRGRAMTSRVRVAVVDEARTEASARILRALAAEQGLRVTFTARASEDDTTQVPLDRARALQMVREGDVPVALVLPAGIDTSLARFDGSGTPVPLLSDPSDPVASQVVSGLLQKVIMSALPDLFASRGIDAFERFSGKLTPSQRQAVSGWIGLLRADRDRPAGAGRLPGSAIGPAGAGMGLARVEVVEVVGRRRGDDMISFYAAGIAVMFLLFSASAGAGTLLDEVDSGTLERVLTTRVGMNGLLAGKWLYLMLLGALQITVMFLYAMFVFHLDLPGHVPGFVLMTVATAATAAAFGLLLATLCRTRQQMSGLATVVILLMSALGGSMFPRFLMSEGMQKAGLFTFNGWALDGYVKVFWRDATLLSLWREVAMLAGFLVLFLAAARLMARRWERA